MRIVFCDDDPAIIKKLQRYLLEYFQTNNLPKPQFKSYPSGDDLLREDPRLADIAFLDIEMPGVSGIYVGEQLKERNPYIKVFIVTSYPDYLDEAMRFRVFRYLTKPIDKHRLFRNMKDALYQHSVEIKKIPIETKEGVVVKYAEEIICAEATARKVLIHTTDECYESVKNMDYWKEQLNLSCFFQTYRSFIVNMRYVASFDESTVRLRARNGFSLDAYLARRRYKEFKDTYLLYLESMQ